MHEHLKEHPEKSFLFWTVVYIYYNNTKTTWDKLTQEQKDNKDFRWHVAKLFCVSKKTLKDVDIIGCMSDGAEFDDLKFENNTNSKFEGPMTKWENKSTYYEIHTCFPLTAYDLKLLLNLFSPRMLHFIE
jgi:hypothetical protein